MTRFADDTPLQAYDRDERRNLTLTDPRLRLERDGPIVRIVGQGPARHENAVVYSGLTEADADRWIRHELKHFGSLGHDFEWKLYGHDTPADLPQRLARHGFTPREAETVLLWRTERALPSPGGVDLRRLRGPEELDRMVAVQNAVWGEGGEWLRDMLAREMTAAPDSLHVYVAFADGAPAATGWLRFAPGSRFAGLYGGSTLPAFRGRGLYRALVARRIRDARERGYPYAVTDAGPMSRPILERLGFEALTSTTPYFSP